MYTPTRIEQYLDEKKKLRLCTALGYDRINRHGGEDLDVEVRILGHETQTSACKAHVTFWTYSGDAKVNRKRKYLDKTHELKPYLSLAY